MVIIIAKLVNRKFQLSERRKKLLKPVGQHYRRGGISQNNACPDKQTDYSDSHKDGIHYALVIDVDYPVINDRCLALVEENVVDSREHQYQDKRLYPLQHGFQRDSRQKDKCNESPR